MLSRLQSKSVNCCAPLFSHIIRHDSSSTAAEKYDNPFPNRRDPHPVRRPIKTGRNSKNEPFTVKDVVPSPFKHRALPFGRKIIFENRLEEDLAKGRFWSKYVDRFGSFVDYDLATKAWGAMSLYKSSHLKQPMDDITTNHDIDYHYHINNLAIHVEMARYIPHLKPLLPELRIDFASVTKKWQDIVREVLPSESDGKLKTTIVEGKPPVGDAVLAIRLAKEAKTSSPRERKEEVRKQIEMSTIKAFVDEKVDDRDFVRLLFVDAMGTKHYVYGMVGETLLQCCRRHCVPIDGLCNSYDRGIATVYGYGAHCAQCQMDISPKYFHLIPPYDWREKPSHLKFRQITPTSRLGCVIWIRPEFDGMVISLPPTIIQPQGKTDG